MSTPGGKLSPLFNASIVLPVGWRISTSRLCVRISNCSRDLRSMCGERNTVYRSMRVGSGIGPWTNAPGSLRGIYDLEGRAIQHFVVIAFHADANPLIRKPGQAGLLSSVRAAAQ